MRTVVLCLALLAPVAALAEGKCDKPVPATVEGRAFAVDGDTIAFPGALAGQSRVRLWGIQAPELRDKRTGQETPAGMAARAAMADRLGAATTCRPTKWDRYCRLVATCISGENDLSAAMLDAGMAYTFMLDDPLHGRDAETGPLAARYTDAERAARRAKAGLWREWLPDHR